MSFGDIVYIVVAILFSIMTFAIIRGNFQRKFDSEGNRLDLKDKDEK
jgi:uncharacterized ion transporter superfamily protein YfcC